MSETRELTVFSISDPDSPAEYRNQLLNVVLRHFPLEQSSIEFRLRAVAMEFGTTWADLGRALAMRNELAPAAAEAVRQRVIESLEQQGFDLIPGDIFFGVNGSVQIAREEPVGNSLLEQVALAAKAPKSKDAQIAELVQFVCDDLGIDEEDEAVEALDEAVHDCKSGEAADINNGGLESQIEFLTEGMSLEEAKNYLRSELAEDDEDSDDEDD